MIRSPVVTRNSKSRQKVGDSAGGVENSENTLTPSNEVNVTQSVESMANQDEIKRLQNELKENEDDFNFHYERVVDEHAVLSIDHLETHRDAMQPMWGKRQEVFGKLKELLDENALVVAEALHKDFRSDHFVGMTVVKRKIRETKVGESVTQRENLNDSSSSSNATSSSQGKKSSVKLPRMDAPTFNGSSENWMQFRDRFETLIHNNQELSEIEKFQYLITGVKIKNADANVLARFQFRKEFYEPAWKALCERYDDKRKILATHVGALVEVQQMTSSTPEEIMKIVDAFSTNLSCLNQLKYDVNEADDFANLVLVHMVEARLDVSTLSEWRKAHKEPTGTWKKLHDFLILHARSLEGIQATKKMLIESTVKDSTKVYAAFQPSAKCQICDEGHSIWKCKLDVQERRKRARERRLCYNCLSGAHRATECPSKTMCQTCNKKHHSMLHDPGQVFMGKTRNDATKKWSQSYQRDESNTPNLSPNVAPFRPYEMRRTVNVAQNFGGDSSIPSQSFVATMNQQAILPTVVVIVEAENGESFEARALLDTGSNVNFMTTKFANRLKLPLQSTFSSVEGVATQQSVVRFMTEAKIQSQYGAFERKLDFSLLPSITSEMPHQDINPQCVGDMRNLFLADEKFYKSERVDLLLNSSIFFESMLNDRRDLASGVILLHTKFGWVVGGSIAQQSASQSTLLSSFSFFAKVEKVENQEKCEIERKLEWMFTSEDVESKIKVMTEEEEYCENVFVKTTTKAEDGRFVVQMPLKSGFEKVGTNLNNAKRQSFFQENRRNKDEGVNKLYVDAMEDFINAGHMEEVKEESDRQVHYLPHHGVVKMDSTSTKLRPVFNASCVSETGQTLNEFFCVGATVQSESYDIILRFREKKFVLMGDITKMYRQIWINPIQSSLLRVIWRSKLVEKWKHYEMKTVTFGTSCAPFLATRCIKQLSIENAENFSEAAEVLEKSFYVDDLLDSMDTVDEGRKICTQIRYILAKVGMSMTKIASNSEEILKVVPEKDRRTNDDKENKLTKALGLIYNPLTDEFSYDIKPIKEGPITKASVLSEIAGIYDLIGWIAPVILRLKLFMKRLWLLKIDWKQKLPSDEAETWKKIRETLPALNELRIKRFCYISNHVRVEIHAFCDASIVGYGAVVYALSYDEIKNVQVSLIASKSKVAPNKQKSLARLELCSANLSAKLVDRTVENLKVKQDSVTLWSDSTIVLHWITMESARLSTFVGNRVSMIQQLTHNYKWKHIKGIDNPADYVSRGLEPEEIHHTHGWWKGAKFFVLPQSEWPQSIISINQVEAEVLQEVKKSSVSLCVRTRIHPLIKTIETRFSGLKKLLNTVVYILRFMKKSKERKLKTFGAITIDELNEAEMIVIRVLQQTFYHEEYKLLMKVRDNHDMNETEKVKHQIARNSCLLELTPFMDEHGIMRVGGRLSNCPISNDQRHPMILPHSQFAKLIARKTHEENLHCGPSSLTSHLRQRYWIVKSRNIIRQVTQRCIQCYRTKPRECQQLMGNLPAARVTMTQPFNATAVDYAGFFNIKSGTTRNAPITKCYIAMFKCMCTGAIHLEVAANLSTDAFLAVFDRFIARRGRCSQLYSDNGTCFEGADNQLKEIIEAMDDKMRNHCLSLNIDWKFTTPRAPHAGGIYESGIKMVKRHLVHVINKKTFTFEEFTTVCCKIEAIVNSRPLTPMSEDPRDLEVLTPGHFLIFRPLTSRPERIFLNHNQNHLTRWEHVQHTQQMFWKKWYLDYLHTLQTRPKEFREKINININDMVLLKDSNLPPMKWLMGRIVQLFPDKQQVVRNVKVRTQHGDKHRNVKYLCLLPNQACEVGQSVPASEEKK